MEKIPDLLLPIFGKLKSNDSSIPNPRTNWVWEGKGSATIKVEGVCYAIIDQQPYRHLTTRIPPLGFITKCYYNKLWWGWEPVPENDPVFWSVWETYDKYNYDWTYQLYNNVLIPHGRQIIRQLEKPTIDSIREYLTQNDTPGVVWWEDLWDVNCRKAKVKRRPK